MQPIIIPTRDCIIAQDGKRYCENEETTAAEFGGFIVALVALCLWALAPLAVNRYMPSWVYWAWWGGIPLVLGIGMMVFG